MITKAFIQDVINQNTVTVRIPLYNKIEGANNSTPNDELPIAPICTVANILNDPHPGDVVFVGFEENNLAKPVVLGYLSKNDMGKSFPRIKCDTLEVNNYANIGDINYEEISKLKNMKQNIAEEISKLNSQIEELKEYTDKLNVTINNILNS